MYTSFRYHTRVLGEDEQVRTIPNAQFVSNTISNMSRRSHRTLKQSIFLTYSSLPIVSEVIDSLKSELSEIPGLNQSTRNYRSVIYCLPSLRYRSKFAVLQILVVCVVMCRVALKSLGETAIEVEIEMHFRGGSGNLFRDRRQAALLTVARVIRECGAEFAILNGLLRE